MTYLERWASLLNLCEYQLRPLGATAELSSRVCFFFEEISSAVHIYFCIGIVLPIVDHFRLLFSSTINSWSQRLLKTLNFHGECKVFSMFIGGEW